MSNILNVKNNAATEAIDLPGPIYQTSSQKKCRCLHRLSIPDNTHSVHIEPGQAVLMWA